MTYNLAKWATEARKAAGMTQEDFALELGFSTKASVNAIEKGRNKPTFETMVKISKISGFPLPYQEVSQTKVLSEDSDSLADDRIRFERLDVVAALGDGYINNEAVEVVDFVHVDKAWAREKTRRQPIPYPSHHGTRRFHARHHRGRRRTLRRYLRPLIRRRGHLPPVLRRRPKSQTPASLRWRRPAGHQRQPVIQNGNHRRRWTGKINHLRQSPRRMAFVGILI